MIWLILHFAILHQAWLYHRQGRFDPFSIYTFIDAAVVVILFGGILTTPSVLELTQQDFGFAAMLPAGQLALYVGLHAFGKKGSKREGAFRTPGLVWLYIASALYLIIAVGIANIYIQIAGMTWADWLFGSRSTAYAIGREIGLGAILNNLFSACQVGVLILIMVALKQRRFAAAMLTYGVLFFGMFLIFTTRFQLLIILMLPLIAWHYQVRRIRGFGTAALVVAFIGMAAFLNLYRGGGIAAAGTLSTDTVVELSSISRGTYLIEPTAELYTKIRDGDVAYEYGANYGYIVVTFVPRALWPDKPLTAFENRMTVEMFGSQIGAAGYANIWTFTAWGEGFAQFDVFGVVLNLFLYGLVVSTSFRYCARRPELLLVWVYYSLLAAGYLRAGFGALFILTLNMIVVAMIFEALPRVRFVGKRKEPNGTA